MAFSRSSAQKAGDLSKTTSPYGDVPVSGSCLEGGKVSQNAFLGAGSQVVGSIVFHGPAVLGGELEGEVHAESRLEVGESAVVKAHIEGVDVIVRGTVHGDITATSKLQLFRSGKIVGNVTCGALLVEDGAVFEGTCRMLNRSPQKSQSGTQVGSGMQVASMGSVNKEADATAEEAATKKKAGSK
jgi:cytoskeletal protein CcmA (bactofilin family)